MVAQIQFKDTPYFENQNTNHRIKTKVKSKAGHNDNISESKARQPATVSNPKNSDSTIQQQYKVPECSVNYENQTKIKIRLQNTCNEFSNCASCDYCVANNETTLRDSSQLILSTNTNDNNDNCRLKLFNSNFTPFIRESAFKVKDVSLETEDCVGKSKRQRHSCRRDQDQDQDDPSESKSDQNLLVDQNSFNFIFKFSSYHLYLCLISTLFCLSLFPTDGSNGLFTSLSLLPSAEASFLRDNQQHLIQNVWDQLTPFEKQHIFGRSVVDKEKEDGNFVPKLDIIRPTLFSPERSRPRGKRSINPSYSNQNYKNYVPQNDADDHNSPHFRYENDEESENFQFKKHISLNGLGRQFNLSLSPNSNLIDHRNFVYLLRDQNGSQIISEKDLGLESQLKCFYHGQQQQQPQHQQQESRQHERRRTNSASAALNICGGISGFILSSDDGQKDDYYAIHPMPSRLHGTTIKGRHVNVNANKDNQNQNQNFPSTSSVSLDSQHHFLWRKEPGEDDIFQYQNRKRHVAQNLPVNQNFRSENGKSAQFKSSQLNSSNRNFNSNYNQNPVNVNSYVDGQNFKHKIHKRSAFSQPPHSFDNTEDTAGDKDGNPEYEFDPEMDPETPSETGYGTYLPRSIPSDSYWLRHRTTLEPAPTTYGSPTQTQGGKKKRRRNRNKIQNVDVNINPVETVDNGDQDYDNHERKTRQNFHEESRTIRYRHISNNSPGREAPGEFHWTENDERKSSGVYNIPFNNRNRNQNSNQPITTSDSEYQNHKRSNTRSTLPPGLEDTEIENIFNANPSENLPFLTKRVDHHQIQSPQTNLNSNDFQLSEESRVAHYPASSASSYLDSNHHSHSNLKVGLNSRDSFFNQNRLRNGSSSLSLEFPEAHWVTGLNSNSDLNSRKGRHDDEIFGENWKSSLDADTDLSWSETLPTPTTKAISDGSGGLNSAQDPISDSLWATQAQKRKENGGLFLSGSGNSDSYERFKPREPAHLTIETAVFIDKDLFKHMQANFPDDTHGEVTRIVLAMINAVQLLYQDPSLGHRVDFVLKRLEVLASDPPGLLRPYDIDRFLTNFCKWQKTENPVSDADPLHWDHALILTGLDLYVVHQSGKISNQVVGLAPVAGMCTRSSSCTVNEGRHFESVYVVAHEIGHNLGMRHDGPQADNDCDPTSHIMSPTLGSGKITWSPCSKRYLDMFLETSQSKCLLDRAKSESRLDHDADGRLPGERFDADRQCVLKYGRGSYHAVQQPLEDVCRDLHCRREHYTWTSHPALEGTFCGIDMWCRAGKCVTKALNSIVSFEHTSSINSVAGSETAAYSALKAMHGAWGKWSPFTDCSSACLTSDDGDLSTGSTGIRLAARRCDSPRPENGGRQCTGPDRRYKTCNAVKVCAAQSSRPKTTEYANEVCARAAAVDTELTGHGFMTNTNDPERACSVWCATSEKGGSRSRGWSFPDGTACKLISHPNVPTFCVAGKCQEFSCDINSHFNLPDEECLISGKDLTPKSWFGNRLDILSHQSQSSSTSSVSIGSNSLSNSNNHRSGKSGWTSWESQSDCKLACLAPAKGLELVKRQCHAGEDQCSGLALSVRLCKPSTTTALSCKRLQTPFEYATKVCGKYAEKISGLSGIGMQLSSTAGDKDRPCRIGCQDEKVAYRFYMVNGEEGWFPAGTDCSRGDPLKKSHCMGGKCIDFGQDDTPNYRITEKLMGTFETFFQYQRNKRQVVYDVMDPASTSAALDQRSLLEIVRKFPRGFSQHSQDEGKKSPSPTASSFFGRQHYEPESSYPRRNYDVNPSALDFSRPVTVYGEGETNFKNGGLSTGRSLETRDEGFSQTPRKNGRIITPTASTSPNFGSHFGSSSGQGKYEYNLDSFHAGHLRTNSHNSHSSKNSDQEYNLDINGESRDSSNGRSYEAPSSNLNSRSFWYDYNFNPDAELIDPDPNNKKPDHRLWPAAGPVEGSYYEWRKIVSDCSVTCGKGVEETIVECVSGDTVVTDSLCVGRRRPGVSGYADCYRSNCSPTKRGEFKNSLWNWIESILPKRTS